MIRYRVLLLSKLDLAVVATLVVADGRGKPYDYKMAFRLGREGWV